MLAWLLAKMESSVPTGDAGSSDTGELSMVNADAGAATTAEKRGAVGARVWGEAGGSCTGLTRGEEARPVSGGVQISTLLPRGSFSLTAAAAVWAGLLSGASGAAVVAADAEAAAAAAAACFAPALPFRPGETSVSVSGAVAGPGAGLEAAAGMGLTVAALGELLFNGAGLVYRARAELAGGGAEGLPPPPEFIGLPRGD